jgi:hypothetical protein
MTMSEIERLAEPCEQFIRLTRSVDVAHGEAFQLMLYRADDGAELWFWNSRDGVTPFGATIEGKEYRHAMHGYPIHYSSVLPNGAQYVWVSHTPETWEAMQRRTYEKFAARPDDEPYGGADFRGQYPTVDDWLALTPFEHGRPRHVSREEFLQNTPEWCGRFAQPQEQK